MQCFIRPTHGHLWLPGERITMGSTATAAQPEVQGASGEGSSVTWPAKYHFPL